MNVSDELKPCPFCKSTDLHIRDLDEETSAVDCDGCNARGPYYNDPDSTQPHEAAELWNTRASCPSRDDVALAERIADELAEKLRPYLRGLKANVSSDSILGIAAIATKTVMAALSSPIAGEWQPIEEMSWPIEQPIIVTDGLSVYGAGWWHPGEQAWLDCDGITPSHWKPLPNPPEQQP